jgi:hypothetical protein
MIRKIEKAFSRETPVLERNRPLIVTIHPRYLEIRRKGTKESYNIPWDACFSLAAKSAVGGAT